MTTQASLLDLRLCDNMDLMREFPDQHFDLAIVDPPYGILNLAGEGSTTAIRKSPRQTGSGKLKNRVLNQANVKWDAAPEPEYFTELRRVSKNQIIWGGNYFDLPPTRGIICWDKEQPWPNFSAWEMAWTSFDTPAKLFRLSNCRGNPGKIHPTQKPVALYSWLLETFATPGCTILDTHLGSGSIAIACHYRGHPLTACDNDPGHYADAIARVDRQTRQLTLFSDTTPSTGLACQAPATP